jgi:hypothetical protein
VYPEFLRTIPAEIPQNDEAPGVCAPVRRRAAHHVVNITIHLDPFHSKPPPDSVISPTSLDQLSLVFNLQRREVHIRLREVENIPNVM